MSARLAVLISGTGSNLQAIIDQHAAGKLSADIIGVISNRPNAAGLERARAAGIPVLALDHKSFDDRQQFDLAMHRQLVEWEADYVALAGFMRILTPSFVRRWRGRMLNIHPSLLPKYQGLNTFQRALDAGDTEAGFSVHFVTEELDGGPVVLQTQVPVLKDDTAETLAERVQQQEHRYFPDVIDWLCAERLRLGEELPELDGQRLTSPIVHEPAS